MSVDPRDTGQSQPTPIADPDGHTDNQPTDVPQPDQVSDGTDGHDEATFDHKVSENKPNH